jgi:hypothetical protein
VELQKSMGAALQRTPSNSRQCSLSIPLLLLVVLLHFAGGVEGYFHRRVPASQSCNITYLRRNLDSAAHIQQLLRVYEHKFFRQPCVSTVTHRDTASLWDQYRPHLEIVIFFHIGLFANTTYVADEILSAMELSGLLQEAKVMYVGISGDSGTG